MIRRRRSIVDARKDWTKGQFARIAGALESWPAQVLVTPRAARIIDMIELGPDRRYVDFGCGTAAYAHVLAEQADAEPPVCLDIAAGPRVDAIAWPEHLPLADGSVDSLTSLYFIRRFDDDAIHSFGGEISRVLAPGGCALVMEIAPVRSPLLDRVHRRLVSPGCPAVDLRGWGRLAALFTECGFDGIDLVNIGPFFCPPVPRVGVLLRRAG